MIFFALISGRGGGQVGDPVEVAFLGRSGNNIYMLSYVIAKMKIFICLRI